MTTPTHSTLSSTSFHHPLPFLHTDTLRPMTPTGPGSIMNRPRLRTQTISNSFHAPQQPIHSLPVPPARRKLRTDTVVQAKTTRAGASSHPSHPSGLVSSLLPLDPSASIAAPISLKDGHDHHQSSSPIEQADEERTSTIEPEEVIDPMMTADDDENSNDPLDPPHHPADDDDHSSQKDPMTHEPHDVPLPPQPVEQLTMTSPTMYNKRRIHGSKSFTSGIEGEFGY